MPFRTCAVTHQSHINSYNRLARRVNHTLSTARHQRYTRALITLQPHDRQDDWERLQDELLQIESLSISKQEDGSLLVSWAAIQ